ncbi:uncharacterized protein LOC105700057 [Orussus abietinus]|uniref:uncharacterized protein LOC105700057 n=1 Tax=Orussus abietinus TaxID=222816 RepID=UPI000C715B33|nr:uncharacterized protein LOC105700057 [Orussus abietinus]
MCISLNTTATEEVMLHTATLARRHMEISFLGSNLQSHSSDQCAWLDNKILAMTKGGVCLIGNWADLSPSQKKITLNRLEQNAVETSTKMNDPASIQSRSLIGPAIWTFWNYLNNEKQCDTLKRLANVFGAPFLAHQDDNEDCLKSRVALTISRSNGKAEDSLSRYIFSNLSQVYYL